MVFYEDIDELYCQISVSSRLGGGTGSAVGFQACLDDLARYQDEDGVDFAGCVFGVFRAKVLEDLEAVLVPTLFRSVKFSEWEVYEHFGSSSCCHCPVDCWAKRAGFLDPHGGVQDLVQSVSLHRFMFLESD